METRAWEVSSLLSQSQREMPFCLFSELELRFFYALGTGASQHEIRK